MEVLLLKQGEMTLKGQNRKIFEDRLIKNIKTALGDQGEFKVYSAQSTIYAEPLDGGDIADGTVEKLKKVFGLSTVSKAAVCQKDMEDIKRTALQYLKAPLSRVTTFRMDAKRSDKRFPLKSPEICRLMGEFILDNFPHLKVDLHTPQVTVTVEIRDYNAFVRTEAEKGAGGLPVGTAGKSLLLLSGGIDSPVAGYMIAKRGVVVEAIHFHSYPYTSMRALEKVEELSKLMTDYCGHIKLYTVPFTTLQEQIKMNCREELFTLIMRRLMMRIAQAVAEKNGCLALITGESIGQVASQTLQGLACSDDAVSMPVFRPLIGMDKEEIVVISRKIDTYETSVLPYEDCCTVFAPPHPKTKPSITEVRNDEAKIDEKFILEAIENTQVKII